MLALATAAVFVLHAQSWRFLCDDAFISFRYARNLARHGELVFNVGAQPPEFVEGYTNFAWVLLLSVFTKLGMPAHTAAPIFTVVFAAAGLVAAICLARALARRMGDTLGELGHAALVIPAVLLVASPEYMVWSGGGLETAAACALTLAAMACWVSGRVVWAAVFTSFAALTRTDTLLPIASFGLVWLALEAAPALIRERKAALASVPWRRLAIATAIFILLVGGHLLWRHAYYGAWLPNTWTIKVHGALLRSTYGADYVQAWVQHVHLWWCVPLLLVFRPRHLLLATPIAVVIGYGWSVGGDFMAYSRFYIVATALLAVLVAWLVRDAIMTLARLTRDRSSLRLVSAVPLVVALAAAGLLGREARERHAADRATPTGWLDHKWEGVTTMDNFAKAGLVAGGWMRQNLPRTTWITVGAAGAVPYASDVLVIDAFGLVDPAISHMPEVKPRTDKRARPGHQLTAPVAYIKRRDPDLLCHVGYRGARRPGSRRVHPAFARGYTWACMQPDADPDAVESPGFYCCRRRIDRVVGPFGQERLR